MNAANRNTLWAGIFAAELEKLGLEAVCIAPGSRSTPLTLAFADTRIKTYLHSDERSAAYFALGLARASGKPVALVCTSGTAAANFFPAVIEANYSEAPLIVLTADRPAEMRESGANQTIDQIKLFGDHVRWFVDVPPPEAGFSKQIFRYLRTLAARAYESAQSPLPGAVHVNFQFRKPLEPLAVPADLPAWMDEAFLANLTASPPQTVFSRPRLVPSQEQVDFLAASLAASPRGLIVCGPRCPAGDFPAQLTELAAKLGYPILADALSGLRFGSHVNEYILGGYDTFLPVDLRPQIVLRFGDVPTSAALCDYLERLEGAPQIYISAAPRWRDDRFCVTHAMWCDPSLLCGALSSIHVQPDPRWLSAWRSLEERVWSEVEALNAETAFEGGILSDVADQIPEGSGLFVANSLPVRHLDQFVRPARKNIRVFANRGASGIDGTLSSALGAAAHLPRLTFVSGDTSFYHDLNGLLAISRFGLRAALVVINNNGGGIFHRLPISAFDPPFQSLFVAPHNLTFEHAARLYGVAYIRVDRAALKSALAEALASDASAIIEVPSDAQQFEALRKAWMQRIKKTAA